MPRSPDARRLALVPAETAPRLAAPSIPTDPRARRIRRTRIAQEIRAGHHRPLKHGAYAVQGIAEDVADQAAWLLAAAPWLDPVRDAVIVEETARALVKVRRLDLVVEATPTLVLTSFLVREQAHLVRCLDALGLTPSAAARLGIRALDAAERKRRMTEQTLAAYRP